jgi:hypothetical protein
LKIRTAFLLCIDISLLLLVLVLECLSFTCLTLHEWIGFASCPVVLLHVVLQWQWFVTQFRRIRRGGPIRTWINALLNVLLLAMVAATLISGVLVAHQVVPFVGERLARIYVWLWVHDSLNKPMLVLVGFHLALNWNWVAALRRSRPIRPAEARPALPADGGPLFDRIGPAAFILRGLGVSAFACAAAVAAYLVFSPSARPPDSWTVTQFQYAAVRAPGGLPARDGRPRSFSHGVDELELVAGIVIVTVLVGRYGLRLRL